MTISPAEYAEAAIIAREAGQHMLERLDLITLQPKKILDLGCGPGHCTTLLKQRYPAAKMLALDYSQTMLRFAKQQYPSLADWVCADAIQLPLPNHSIDFIFANLLLPWCDNTEKLLQEWRRVLCPEGLLMFTSLGPDTLRELPQLALHLPHLIDMHDIGDMLTRAGFVDPVLDVEYFTLTYRQEEQLFYELKATGMVANNINVNIEKNTEGVFPLTYEVIYGHAWGPAMDFDRATHETGEIRIPLSHLRRR